MTVRRQLAIPLLLMLAACGGFDRERWASGAGNYEGPNPRLALVAAAQDAGVATGATQDTIRALLGTPDSQGPRADVWYLGRAALAPDYQTLVVTYDAKGVATAVSITQS